MNIWALYSVWATANFCGCPATWSSTLLSDYSGVPLFPHSPYSAVETVKNVPHQGLHIEQAAQGLALVLTAALAGLLIYCWSMQASPLLTTTLLSSPSSVPYLHLNEFLPPLL